MPDPDLEIGGEGQSTKNFFPPFRPQFGLKIRGGGAGGGAATVSSSFFEMPEHSNM